MRRHRLDPVSLAFGLAFVGIGGVVLAEGADVSLAHLRWVAAGTLLVLGLAMLLGTRSRGPRGHEEEEGA